MWIESLRTRIITCETTLTATVEEWKSLLSQAARFPFADPDLFIAWWQMRGKPAGHRLHVVTCRQDGTSVAIAPLVVTRRWGMRILEWGGSEIFDYSDTLLLDQTCREPLWQAIRRSGLY